MKGLGTRLLTSVVAVPILIGLIGWAPWQGFAALAFVAIAVGLWEFTGIVMSRESAAMRGFVVLLGLLVQVSMLWIWSPPATRQALGGFPQAPMGTPILLLALVACAVAFLFGRGRQADLSPIPGHIGLSFLGVIYLGFFSAHIIFLARLPDAMDFRVHHASWLFLVLACTFMSDTGGYFFGVTIGGPKLYPSVSPNKTWAGLLGCVVGASLGAWGVRMVLMPFLTWYDCLFLGLGAALLGQTGDFFESLLKRAYDVKDSGTILPGHGGILDRIDALLFNGPFIFYYAMWVVLPR